MHLCGVRSGGFRPLSFAPFAVAPRKVVALRSWRSNGLRAILCAPSGSAFGRRVRRARARSARGCRPPVCGPSLFPAALGGGPTAPAQPSLAAPFSAREDTARAVPVACSAPVRPSVGSVPSSGAPPLRGPLVCRAPLPRAGLGRACGAPSWAVPAPPGKGQGQGQKGL